MDWMRLFALLVAVASIPCVSADGSKKKIRIHLPQKVKHIHHHKKIYITNHHASSQYAPAYVPNAEGSVAVPTNIAIPSVANVLPINSVELFDQSEPHFPGMSPSASKILPLYHARGYYGPTPNEWDEQEYDIASPSEPADNSYSPPSPGPASAQKHPPKRVKILKVNEQPPKKGNRKPKPKRVPGRVRPAPPTEDEHPVSKFHEHFYSDLDGSGTIRKVKKPQRVEKIIDGDTEHIHTYSEEHIHKLVYDEDSKVPGVDPVGSSSINTAQPLIPIKNSLIAIPTNAFPGFAAFGSLGTPTQYEYASYNPRDVTHDHIFHDHGEIPPDVDLAKEPIGFPPKVSYNSQGLRISDASKTYKKFLKPTKSTPNNDLSYYESLYSPYNRLKKQQNQSAVSHFESSVDTNYDTYRPVPAFNFLGKNPHKVRSTYAKQIYDQKPQHTHSPYSVSSTIIHDYRPKPEYPGALPPTGFSSFKDPYDTYASPSNFYASENKNNNPEISGHNVSGKKKSISTQSIRFGRQDPARVSDDLEDSFVSAESIHDNPPSAFEDDESYDKNKASDGISPTPYTIKDTSPAHLYYTAMALKALYDEPASMPEASNDNPQYAEAPADVTTTFSPTIATTTATPEVYFSIQSAISNNNEPINYNNENGHRQKRKQRHSVRNRDLNKLPAIQDLHTLKELFYPDGQVLRQPAIDSGAKGKLRYGDKI